MNLAARYRVSLLVKPFSPLRFSVNSIRCITNKTEDVSTHTGQVLYFFGYVA